MSITCLRAGNLRRRHGFLGRTGGVSAGLVASLNMGLGAPDDPANVQENRRRGLLAACGRADLRLVTVYQVHSARAVVAGDWRDADRPQADALVTDRPGVALGILTADCAPVLLEDPAAGVVAAAHAGWRGAFGGVLEATVDAMVQLGAGRDRIAAAVGPCIGRRAYEVDLEFRARFLAADPDTDRFFAAGRAGHVLFDLEGYCLARLAAAGVRRVVGLGVDTLSDPTRFFSYRRSTLAGEGGYGRQISIIAAG